MYVPRVPSIRSQCYCSSGQRIVNWKIIPARFSVTIPIQVAWNCVTPRRYRPTDRPEWERNNNQESIVKRNRERRPSVAPQRDESDESARRIKKASLNNFSHVSNATSSLLVPLLRNPGLGETAHGINLRVILKSKDTRIWKKTLQIARAYWWDALRQLS